MGTAHKTCILATDMGYQLKSVCQIKTMDAMYSVAIPWNPTDQQSTALEYPVQTFEVSDFQHSLD